MKVTAFFGCIVMIASIGLRASDYYEDECEQRFLTTDSDQVPLTVVKVKKSQKKNAKNDAIQPDSFNKSIKDLPAHKVRNIGTELDLSNQELSSLTDFRNQKYILDDSLAALTTLKLRNNRLQSDAVNIVLQGAHGLEFLDVGGNKIEKLDFSSHDKLQTLLLDHNQIKTISLAGFCARFPNLKKLALHGNQFQPATVTEIDSIYAKLEEIWFDKGALNDMHIRKCIQVFPDLTAEIVPDSIAVRDYYTKKEQCYYRHDPCVFRLSVFLGIPTSAVLGLAFATMTSVIRQTSIHLPPQEADAMYAAQCGAWISSVVVVGQILLHGAPRLWGYCTTKPEDRYHVTYMRAINKEPEMLKYISNASPQQEQ